jgi:hypothetical protein
MKKLLFTTAIVGLLSGAAFAQTDWSLSGNALTGTAPTPNEWLGSSNGYDLVFKTNNAQRMIMSSSGNLGVGATYNTLYRIYSYQNSTSHGAAGIRGEVITPNSASNHAYGVLGFIDCGTGYTYGLYGRAYNTTAQLNGRSYGTFGIAGNASSGWNYGAYGALAGTNNGAGIFASDGSGDASVPGMYAAYFNGQIRTTNDSPEKPTGGAWIGYSDKRLKKDINKFDDGLDVLRKIDPVSYRFNGIGKLSSNESHIGIIAQDVQKVAPYCIGTGKIVVNASEAGNFDKVQQVPGGDTAQAYIAEVLNYNPDGLFYVMINSIKELDKANQAAMEEIKALKSEIEQLKSGQQTAATESMSMNGNCVDQNKPNPFAEKTTIGFNLGTTVKMAEIQVFDQSGKLVKKQRIENRGNGSIELTVGDLSAGTYSYSIVADGVVVGTKQMVISK